MHRSSVLPLFVAAAFSGTAFANCAEQLKSVGPPHVKLSTTMGDIVIQLERVKAPISTENFAKYVDSGHYDGTIFHRVIDNFMIQGGGISKELVEKPAQPPIKNEASNGLRNDTYTVAMARTSAPDSATAQFFINVKDNDFLNQNPSSAGYAVFGKVIEGKDVVDKIKKVAVKRSALSEAQPLEPIIIKKAECVAPSATADSKGQK